ncbi:MAG: FISUMP domain-containing protein, partial [Ignavibacteria bacterium]
MKTIMRVFCLIIFMQLSVLNFSCQDSSDPIDVPISDNHESITLCNKTVMKMNLNTDKYRDGSSIRHASTNEEWIDANRKKEGAWCYYSGNTQNGSQFGKLYNWYAVTSPKGLAPNGWRIPTDEEFDIIFACS